MLTKPDRGLHASVGLVIGVLTQVKPMITFSGHISFCVKYSVKSVVLIGRAQCHSGLTASVYFLRAERLRVRGFHTTVYCCQPNGHRSVLVLDLHVCLPQLSRLRAAHGEPGTAVASSARLAALLLWSRRERAAPSATCRQLSWSREHQRDGSRLAAPVSHPFLLQIPPSLLLSQRKETWRPLRTLSFSVCALLHPFLPLSEALGFASDKN